MAKKSTVNSVALFDDEPSVIKKAPKQTETSSSKDKTSKTSKLTSKKKASPNKEEKPTKKTKIVKDDNRNSKSSICNLSSNTGDVISKTESKTSGRRKQQSTSSADEKSGNPVKAKSKNSSRVDTNKNNNNRSSKSGKNTNDKGTTRRAKKDNRATGKSAVVSSGKGKSISSTNSAVRTESKGEQQKDKSNDIFKEAKRHKHKFTRGPELMGPRQIAAGPKTISDDLVAIVIDKEYYEVSPWSVKDGVYYQGLDSHYLVNYLYYKPVSTKYDEIDKQYNIMEETKKKKK